MKKKLVLASSACLVASAMALSGCSGSSKPAETSAAAEKSEAAADTTTAAAESGSSDTMHLSFYYPVNVGGDAAKLIEKIAELVRDKKIDGITDLNDHSSREGMRICIELRKDVNANVILNQLYKHTQMQDTFGVNMLAVADGRPETMGVVPIIRHHVKFQYEIATRKYQTLLAK